MLRPRGTRTKPHNGHATLPILIEPNPDEPEPKRVLSRIFLHTKPARCIKQELRGLGPK
jgi:hypothetical protein